MGPKDPTQARHDRNRPRGADPEHRARTSRLYIDAAAPGYAHDALEELVCSPSWARPKRLQGPALELQILTLYLESCSALGHREHLERYAGRLEDLCMRAWNARCEQFQCERAATAGRIPDDVLVRATALLGRFLIGRGDYETALAVCRRVPEEVVAGASGTAALHLHARIQEALARLGDFEGAEAAISRFLGRAESEEDDALRGSAYALLGSALRMRGRLKEAQRMYADAAHLHARGGDYAGTARDHLNRGWLLNRMGLVEEAAGAFRQARDQAERIGHALVALKARNGIAVTEIRSGRPGSARKILLASWRTARRFGLPRQEALALEFLGEALILERRLPQARRALSLCNRLGGWLAAQGDIVAECHIRLAYLALVEGSFKHAAEHALEAADLAAVLRLPWEEAQARRLLGAALALSGRDQRAEAHRELEAALHLLESMGERLEAGLVREWLVFLDEPAPDRCGDRHPAFHPGERRNIVVTTIAEPGVQAEPRGAEFPWADAGTATLWAPLGLVTRSPRMIGLLEEARDLAASGANVLIQGETGTGKDLLAAGIHRFSGRTGKYIPMNCGGCPAELFEAELFGAERGAFTGADRKRGGLILEAEEGTLFLDEIGDLDARSQTALLRFLDSGEVRALGSSVIRTVRVGVVAATHHPLPDRIRFGEFRRDLYYRLAQGTLEIPPLRERFVDLPLLLPHLWARQTNGESAPETLLDEEVLRVLRSYTWPGNIRELDHFVRRVRLMAVRAARGGPCDEQIVPGRIRDLMNRWMQKSTGERASVPDREEIRRALKAAKGNRARAAEQLGISRARLYRLLGKPGGELGGPR